MLTRYQARSKGPARWGERAVGLRVVSLLRLDLLEGQDQIAYG